MLLDVAEALIRVEKQNDSNDSPFEKLKAKKRLAIVIWENRMQLIKAIYYYEWRK